MYDNYYEAKHCTDFWCPTWKFTGRCGLANVDMGVSNQYDDCHENHGGHHDKKNRCCCCCCCCCKKQR